VTAPLQLRSDGDESPGYHGRTSVDAATPWFQALVRQAKEEAGARLAAVPINGTNEAKWEAMPVETLELPTSGGGVGGQAGLVPHSRGAIGAKDLEQLPIDAVLCGVQVQGPAATARRVVALWELLAPEHDDPTDALERGWRLLAQHAVSGTIKRPAGSAPTPRTSSSNGRSSWSWPDSSASHSPRRWTASPARSRTGSRRRGRDTSTAAASSGR